MPKSGHVRRNTLPKAEGDEVKEEKAGRNKERDRKKDQSKAQKGYEPDRARALTPFATFLLFPASSALP